MKCMDDSQKVNGKQLELCCLQKLCPCPGLYSNPGALLSEPSPDSSCCGETWDLLWKQTCMSSVPRGNGFKYWYSQLTAYSYSVYSLVQNVCGKESFLSHCYNSVWEPPFCRNPASAQIVELCVWGWQSLITMCAADERDLRANFQCKKQKIFKWVVVMRNGVQVCCWGTRVGVFI